MKRIYKSVLMLASFALFFSCADDSLDPLQFKSVKKGSILALRGTQLRNIYFDGLPGAEFFPKIADGTEKFEFDAEFVSEDLNSLESMDIYVVKRTRVGTRIQAERIFIRNVPFSAFKNTADYKGPWVSVSIDLTEILDKLGLDYTNEDDVDTLLDIYKFGINIETDLTLKGGVKVLAKDIVADGLFQSDIFYPAQRLTYAVTDYCSYDPTEWAASYTANEYYENGAYGPYTVTLTRIAGNQFRINNFWDYGIQVFIEFEESEDPASQIVAYIEDQDEDVSGSGKYDQCLGKIILQTDFEGDAFRYDLARQE